MRTHMGDYAYEVTMGLSVETEVSCCFTVYKATPIAELLANGQGSPSQDHAERNARQLIALYIELDRMRSEERSGSINAHL